MQSYSTNYDVVIFCRPGLVGLILAKQLRMQLQGQTILMPDRLKRHLAKVAHKIRESTLHPRGTSLLQVLGLKDYLNMYKN